MESFFSSNNLNKKKIESKEEVAEFIHLCERLRDNEPNTNSVTIGHHSDQSKTMALCQALEDNTVVQRVRLDFQNGLMMTPRPLLEFLQYAPKLSIVEVSGMNFNDSPVCTALLLLLKSIARNPAVHELALEVSDAKDRSIFGSVSSILQGTHKDCLLLHSGLASSFRHFKYIESLWLEHINDVILCQMLPSLRHLGNLRTLTLVPCPYEQSDTTFDTIGALVTASTSLDRLELHDCSLTTYRMNTVARGLRNSASVTELGLHTSQLDAGATDQLRALYCRQQRKRRGSTISALSIGHGVHFSIPLVELLRVILGSGTSTLQRLDLRSQSTCDDAVLRYFTGQPGDGDWLSAMFRTGWKAVLPGSESDEVVEEPRPQLTELKWGLLETEESLSLFGEVIANMTSLVRVTVEVDESLDPVDILALSKSQNVEMCCINGQTYDLKGISASGSTKRRIKRKQPSMEPSDEEEKSFQGSFDGIGLESVEAEQIDLLCDQDGSILEEPCQSDTIENENEVENAEHKKNALADNEVYLNELEGNNATENTTQPIEPAIQDERRSVESQATSFDHDGPKSFDTKRLASTGLTLSESNCSDMDRSVPARRAPSHTKSDTAVLLQMGGRLADIRKYGNLRKDPFFFERKGGGLDIRSEATKRPPNRSMSDTQCVFSRQLFVQTEAQDYPISNVAEEVENEAIATNSDYTGPTQSRQEEILKEVREDIAIFQTIAPLDTTYIGQSTSTDGGSVYELEGSDDEGQENSQQIDHEDSPISSKVSDLSFHTADEAGVEQMRQTGLVEVDLPDYMAREAIDSAALSKKDNASVDSFHTATPQYSMTGASLSPKDSPASFVSPNKVPVGAKHLMRNDKVDVADIIDNSSSSELLDFDMELTKVLG